MKILIAGGGIGGLATALCLHGGGIEAEVFEQAPSVRELGVGINVLPHAIKVLATLGLLPALDEAGIRTRELIYTNRFGQTVWRELRGMDAGYDTPQLSIHRGKLLQVLFQAAVERLGPARIHVDHRLVDFQERGDRVVARFERTEGAGSIEADGDALIGAALTDGERDIMLFASNGKAVRFDEGSVRSMGRTATGVRGMKLAEGERVVSLIVVEGEGDILTASQNGYGKRTALTEFPKKGRGTLGVIAMKTSERNGALIGAIQLSDHHDVLLISDGGTLVRTRAAEISQVGRNTQGVTLMRLAEGETLQAIERLDASLDADADADAGDETAAD